MKRPIIRHIIHVAEGTLVTIEDGRSVESNYREFRRLNTLAALEAAFLGMGFHLVKRTSDQIIYEKATKPMSKTCTVKGCDQPRMVSKRGKTLFMCEQHQKEYWRDHRSSRNGSRKPQPADAAPLLPPPNSRCIQDTAFSGFAAPSAASSSPTPTTSSTSPRTLASADGALP